MIHVHSYWIWFPTSESGFRNGQSKQAMAFQRRKSSSSVLVHQVEKTPPPLLERETIMILLTSRLATSPLQQALVFRTWNLHGNTKPELLRFSISIHRLLSSRNRHSPVAIELQSCRVQRRRHFPLQTQLVYPTVRKGASAFIIIIIFFFISFWQEDIHCVSPTICYHLCCGTCIIIMFCVSFFFIVFVCTMDFYLFIPVFCEGHVLNLYPRLNVHMYIYAVHLFWSERWGLLG